MMFITVLAAFSLQLLLTQVNGECRNSTDFGNLKMFEGEWYNFKTSNTFVVKGKCIKFTVIGNPNEELSIDVEKILDGELVKTSIKVTKEGKDIKVYVGDKLRTTGNLLSPPDKDFVIFGYCSKGSELDAISIGVRDKSPSNEVIAEIDKVLAAIPGKPELKQDPQDC